MTVTQQRTVAVLGLLVLGLYSLMSIGQAVDRADVLRTERQNLARIQRQIAEINEAARAPQVAALEAESSADIVNRIAAAVKQANLPASAFENQTPSTPARNGQSDFLTRKTEIALKSASVKQIVAFCRGMRDEATGSVIRDLNLHNPKRVGARETWDCQMTLTQTIFSPKSDS